MVYRKTARVAAKLADNRSRILHAARRLVAESGFREAQIAAIAAAAGVATGSVYRYFPSRAELFAEVLALTSQREVEVIEAIAAAGGTAAARLADAVRAFASRALRARQLAYSLIAEPVDPEIDQARLQYRHALGEAFARILADGARSGEFPDQDLAAGAACVVGAMLEGLVGPLAPRGDGREETRRRATEAIVAFCLRAVGAPAPAVSDWRLAAGHRPGALGQIVALHGEYYGREWRFGPQFECEVATELAAFVARLDPGREGLWLALRGEAVLGSIAVQSEGGAARIRWFITAPALRGRGSGRALLDAALGFCRERAYRRAFLWTFAGLDAARHLYETTGFRLVEERADELWGAPVVHQRFELELKR